MKKLAKISAAAIAGFMLFGFTTLMHDSSFEGVIKYDIKVDSDNPQVAQYMQGSSMTTYIKGDKSMTEGDFGMTKTIIITDRKNPGNPIRLMNIMGNKYQIKTDDKTKEEQEKNKPEIKYLTGTKTIAGYACKEAQLTMTDKKTNQKYTSDVYYTDQLPYGEDPNFGTLKGFPMSFTMKQSGMTMTMVVTSVQKQSVSDSLFVVPAGYKLMTPEEMQKDMMSHMGGGGN